MSEPTITTVGVDIFIQVVAAILTVAVTGLIGWVYNVNSRVTVLETERVNLDNLEKLLGAKVDNLEKLINLKFEHMQELFATAAHTAAVNARHQDGRD